MSSATKAQSQKIFEKLKTKPANKVGLFHSIIGFSIHRLKIDRYASTAAPKIQLGLRSLLVFTSVSIAPRTIAI